MRSKQLLPGKRGDCATSDRRTVLDTISSASTHYGIVGQDAMPAEGHSKETVNYTAKHGGRREACLTSRVHLPNSLPKSKKRKGISTLQLML